MSSQQVLHQSKSFGAMRGSGSSGNGTSAPRAPLKRAARESCENLLGCTQEEVHSSFHGPGTAANQTDRKSTRLNSSHLGISYAVFCLKKKKKKTKQIIKLKKILT